jgi:hypothetical protein
VASTAAGLLAWVLAQGVGFVLGDGFVSSLAACVVGLGTGFAVFIWLALRMHVAELTEVVQLVRRPRASSRPESVPT